MEDVTAIDIKQEEGPKIFYGGLVNVKLEKEEILSPDEVPATNIKQETGPQIFYGGLVHVKLEKEEILSPDDGTKDSVNGIEENSQYSWKATMKNNLGKNKHQCPYCDYKALKGLFLKTHIMSRHTGEKPHQCPYLVF
ncbi:uncharacterized protein [Halyomorpha halys]|uniref:uncharacterized protein n=1 Tax=Halyomorpha halys TaxID=286706 RepID=UPI0034D183F6